MSGIIEENKVAFRNLVIVNEMTVECCQYVLSGCGLVEQRQDVTWGYSECSLEVCNKVLSIIQASMQLLHEVSVLVHVDGYYESENLRLNLRAVQCE